MTNIPLVNLRRNYDTYRADYDRILCEAAGSCGYILGKYVTEFESDFAQYLGVKHVVGVGSGTDALTLSLRALGLKPGSLVLTQANTFIATTLAIQSAGHTIALCDVDAQTGVMDLASYTGPRPDVVIPVHLFGTPFDAGQVKARWDDDVYVLEDACQAHGSMLHGRRCGALGECAAFSFYPGKNLGAFGDGGAIATDNDAIAEEVRALRNWGGTQKYVHDRAGGNSRLDGLQAAILTYKLMKLDEWNARRNEHARAYQVALADSTLVTPAPAMVEDAFSCYHLFPVLVADGQRDALLDKLNTSGIGAGIHYPIPIHKQKVYAETELSELNLPNAETRAEAMLSLPLCPQLSDDERRTVCELISLP